MEFLSGTPFIKVSGSLRVPSIIVRSIERTAVEVSTKINLETH